MVMAYGMSEDLGLRTYGEQTGSVFLGRSMTYDRNYSEEAARKIDSEVRSIVDRNYQRALDIIKENKHKMVRLSEALIEFETLDRSQFEILMNEEPQVPTENETLVPAD